MAVIQAYLEAAKGAIISGSYDRAIEFCHHVLAHRPKHLEAHCMLAEAYRERGDAAAAEGIFLRVLSADPERIIARWALSIMHGDRGERDVALAHLRLALEISPDHTELRKEVVQMSGHRAKLSLAGLARVYMRGGLLDLAIQEFRAALALEPQRLDLLVGLAEALWRSHRDRDAAELCHRILSDSPDCLKPLLILGAIKKRALDSEQAHPGEWIAAQELDPDAVTARQLAESAGISFGDEWAVLSQGWTPAANESEYEAPPDLYEPVAVNAGTETSDLLLTQDALVEESAVSAPEIDEAPGLSFGEDLAELTRMIEQRTAEMQRSASTAVPQQQPAMPEPDAEIQSAAAGESQAADPSQLERDLAELSRILEQHSQGAQIGQRSAEPAQLHVAEADDKEHPAPLFEDVAPASAESLTIADQLAQLARMIEHEPQTTMDDTGHESAAKLPDNVADILSLTDNDSPSVPDWLPASPDQAQERADEGLDETAWGKWADLLGEEVNLDPDAEARLSSALAEMLSDSPARPGSAKESEALPSDAPDTIAAGYRRALQLNPNDHVTRLALAHSYKESGETEAAVAEYRNVVKAAPDLCSEAAEGLLDLLRMAPKHAAAHRALGDAYIKTGRFQQAIDEYNQALALENGGA